MRDATTETARLLDRVSEAVQQEFIDCSRRGTTPSVERIMAIVESFKRGES